MRGIYIYYPLWSRASRKLVNQVIKKNGIRVYHQLTYGNALWGVNPIVKDMVFIWGPIGGLEIVQSEFSRHFSLRSRLIEFIRRTVARMVTNLPAYLNRCASADLILCKTQSMMDKIPMKHRGKALLFTDVATEKTTMLASKTEKNRELVFLAVGRLDGWRGFDLIIEAFSLVCSKTTLPVKLRILGDGKEKNRLLRLIEKYNLNGKVSLLGNVSMEQYQHEMQQCNVVLNACLKEGGVTNAFDCMSHAKPLICLETGGYTQYFDHTCSVVIKKHHRDQIINDFSESIILLTNDTYRTQLAHGMRQKVPDTSWKVKGEKINTLIRDTISSVQQTAAN